MPDFGRLSPLSSFATPVTPADLDQDPASDPRYDPPDSSTDDPDYSPPPYSPGDGDDDGHGSPDDLGASDGPEDPPMGSLLSFRPPGAPLAPVIAAVAVAGPTSEPALELAPELAPSRPVIAPSGSSIAESKPATLVTAPSPPLSSSPLPPSCPLLHPLPPPPAAPRLPSLTEPVRGSYSIIAELIRNRDLYRTLETDPTIRIRAYPSTIQTAIDCTIYQMPTGRPGRGTVLSCALHHGLDALELDPVLEELEQLRARVHGPDSFAHLGLQRRQQLVDWMNRCPLRPDALTGAGDEVTELQVRIPAKSHQRLGVVSRTLGIKPYSALLWAVMAGLADQDHLREYSEMFAHATREFVEVVKARLGMYRTLAGELAKRVETH